MFLHHLFLILEMISIYAFLWFNRGTSTELYSLMESRRGQYQLLITSILISVSIFEGHFLQNSMASLVPVRLRCSNHHIEGNLTLGLTNFRQPSVFAISSILLALLVGSSSYNLEHITFGDKVQVIIDRHENKISFSRASVQFTRSQMTSKCGKNKEVAHEPLGDGVT